jgi:aminopeptidase N
MNNAYNRTDRSTYSNPSEVLSTVVHLEWNLNFDTNIISGSVTHSMVVVAHHGAETAKFDSSGLTITSVEVNSHPVQYSIGESSDALGKCLIVPIPTHLKSVGDEFDLKFNYSTSPNASAAQWLSAKATKSGNHVSSPSVLPPPSLPLCPPSSTACELIFLDSHSCSRNAKLFMLEACFLVKILQVSRRHTPLLSSQ